MSCKKTDVVVAPYTTCFFDDANKPKNTSWKVIFENEYGDTVSWMGTDGEWNRESGFAKILHGEMSMTVKEPAAYANGRCAIQVTSLSLVTPDHNVWYLKGVQWLQLSYLGDGAISGFGDIAIESEQTVGATTKYVQADVTLDFDVVKPTCSATETPDTSNYTISLSGSPGGPATETFHSNVTRWDRNIELIVFGPNPGGDNDPEQGMNILIAEPVGPSGDSCTVTITYAQLTTTDRRLNPTEVRVYVFPTSNGEDTTANTYLRIFYLNDSIISGRVTALPMQRIDSTGNNQIEYVNVDFDAYEPGFLLAPPKR